MITVPTTYKEKIARISQRIVDAQRPIRVLDSIKWPIDLAKELQKSKFKDIPKILPEDYEKKTPLNYKIEDKQRELKEIIDDIKRDLGQEDAIGELLIKTTEQYHDVVEMLAHRGTGKFGHMSAKLYGSPRDLFFDGKTKISELGQLLYKILCKIDHMNLGLVTPDDIPADEVVKVLNERFKSYFDSDEVRAKISDGIVADASAGGDTVKIRADALFSKREIDILEVHEGWVHVGTTLNGNNQRVAKWLSKGPPRVASTQEGLAIIMEIFTFRSYPKRAKQINDRILGVEKVEDGANILELLEFYRTEGYSEQDALYNVKRIFRGAPLEGGSPFTKDISYCKGFIENYNFMRSAIRSGRPYLLPFLFVGKANCDDIPLLYQKHLEGIIEAPQYLPPQFKDLNGLTVWMSFSNFLNTFDLNKIHDHYDKLFHKHL